jgi:hypothetical protein
MYTYEAERAPQLRHEHVLTHGFRANGATGYLTVRPVSGCVGVTTNENFDTVRSTRFVNTRALVSCRGDT